MKIYESKKIREEWKKSLPKSQSNIPSGILITGIYSNQKISLGEAKNNKR